MPQPPKKLILSAALALAAAGANAQTVWRCGNSYSTQPCSGGTSFEVAPPPSQADIAQAEKAAQADASRADALRKARLVQEKNAPRAIVMAQPEQKTVAEKKGDPKKGKPGTFKASAPGNDKAKGKDKDKKAD